MSDIIPECPHPDNEIIEGEFCWTCLKCRRAMSKSFYPSEFVEKFKITNVEISFDESMKKVMDQYSGAIKNLGEK